MKDHIVEAIVAVDDRSPLLLWNCLRKPVDQALHVLDAFGFRGTVLLNPTVDLTRAIVSRPSKVTQSDSFWVESVKICESFNFRCVNGSSACLVQIRQRAIPEHSALLHRHNIEHRAQYSVVRTKSVRTRGRKPSIMKRGYNSEFPVNRMCGRKKFPRRLTPKNIRGRRCVEPIGRIR